MLLTLCACNHAFATILFAASTAFAATNATSQRLNVLYIVSDDLNNDLGCYGDPVVKSPNLDRLAARGVRFDRAYCNYPVCNASRTSFLSGRRPDTTRIVDNVTPPRTFLKDAVFMPEYFRQQGYRTIKVGKIYHTGDDFEDPRSWDTDIRETSQAKRPPAAQILRRQGPAGVVLRLDDKDTWDGFVARKAVELLQQCVKEKPFLSRDFAATHAHRTRKIFRAYDQTSSPRYGPLALANIPDLALISARRHEVSRKRPGDTIAAYYARHLWTRRSAFARALDRLKLWTRRLSFSTATTAIISRARACTRCVCSRRRPACHSSSLRRAGNWAPRPARGTADLYPTPQSVRAESPADPEGTNFAPLLDHPVAIGSARCYRGQPRQEHQGDAKTRRNKDGADGVRRTLALHGVA